MSKEEGLNKFITSFKKGEVIYTRGEPQDSFFIVNKGKVQLKVGDDELIVVSLLKGDFFGEESLNESQVAAYTVDVLEDTDVVKIPYPSLMDMMQKNTEISLKILKKQADKNLKILESMLSMMYTQVPGKRKTVKTEKVKDDTTAEKVDPNVQAYLLIQRSNRVVQLTKTQTFLGRRDYTTGFIPDVDLTKEDEEKYISRKHAKLEFIDGKFYISEESGAVNGTFLNGVKLTTGVKHELKNEDEITLCHLNINFKY